MSLNNIILRNLCNMYKKLRVIMRNDLYAPESRVQVLQFYALKRKFSLKICTYQSENRYGYQLLIKASVSQVISSTLSFIHNTMTIEMILFLNSFILLSTIPISYTSKDKYSLSSTGGASRTCNGSNIYFLNMETWKTSWMCSKSRGHFNR